MTYPIIAAEYRGGILENTHQGVVCVIDQDHQTIYAKGPTSHPTFYRSAMKPIQAIPIFKTDVMERYELTDEEAALFTASQRGEPYHQDALERLTRKLNISEELLVCSASYPLNEQPKQAYIWQHKAQRRLFHNCAGKHLGFLAYAREMGYDVHTYEQLKHPIQQEILHYVAELAQIPVEEVRTGVDGCGVPVYAVPLKNMAISYLNFAAPELINDCDTANAVRKIDEVMHAHPEIVASHHFVCSVLLEDDNIIAKGGAQGVYCLSLKREKISIALKVLSGSERIWSLLIAELLKKIKYSNTATIERLLQLAEREIKSDSGKVIGETKIMLNTED